MSQNPPSLFGTERLLVEALALALRGDGSPWGAATLGFEVDYEGGRADLVALLPGNRLLAFEAKLRDWRRALHQAYRTRCFAEIAYVVLPAAVACRAALHAGEFSRRRVGLCTLEEGRGIRILLDATQSEPLQPWVRARAIDSISSFGEQADDDRSRRHSADCGRNLLSPRTNLP